MPDDLPETRFRRHVTRRLKCAFSPQRQSRAHPVDGRRASTAPRSPNAASDRASRSFTIAQTRFSAKSRKVVARRTVVARAVAETEAETKAEKPKRKFSPKKNVTVQDADIAVGNKYEGKVVRHPSFTRILYHPNRAAKGCERGKCDRGARGGSAPGRHRMFRFVVHPRPNPAASGLFRQRGFSYPNDVAWARGGCAGWTPRRVGTVGTRPTNHSTPRGATRPTTRSPTARQPRMVTNRPHVNRRPFRIRNNLAFHFREPRHTR
jgi:hypothetical protein